MSAVARVVERGFVPFADYCIFGKHGKRMLAKLLYVAFIALPDGTRQRRELPGPPSYSAWCASWRVFRATLLLLDVASTDVLDQYADHVRDLVELYGEDVWFLVSLADCRMRSEEFPRLRRELELIHEEKMAAQLPSSYDPLRSWDSVFAAATGAKDYWHDEVREKAIMWKCRVKASAELVAEGAAQPTLGAVPAPPHAATRLSSNYPLQFASPYGYYG